MDPTADPSAFSDNSHTCWESWISRYQTVESTLVSLVRYVGPRPAYWLYVQIAYHLVHQCSNRQLCLMVAKRSDGY